MFVLLLVHVLAAIFWMGGTLFFGFVLEPVLAGLGAKNGEVMVRLIPRIHRAMTVAGLVTILAGLGLYALHTSAFDLKLMFETRLPLTLGAFAGLLALLVGVFFQGPTGAKLLELYAKATANGAPLSPDEARAAAVLKARLGRGGQLETILMLLALIGMVI
ncbi:hypothetical protein [Oceanithermus desulfurans]|uniref:Copper resistance protein D domain-containing protein n=2 Tax=Oceanithermus desulfurans TaxID=227924 RepID=A0A511RNY8_9DEIN|nr:hypothetical protein [Oceanithermus desulfurans]MBB6030795.1 putative membrane protein [Oceanithermus desulfurans]GEM90642.1 hypothetical protein ODE01S_20760 [Oceanithermus desulfurans NBRC 100063]